MIRLILLGACLFVSITVYACDSEYVINLQTVGQNVIVELRAGVPDLHEWSKLNEVVVAECILAIYALEDIFLQLVMMRVLV